MPYKLKNNETISTGVKRIAHQQLKKSIDHLEGIEKKPHKRVHSARKAFKRLRGLIRLVRLEVGDEVYKRENVCYRDAGRELSAARDATVTVKTFDNLMDRFKTQVSDDGFTSVRELLVARRDAIHRQMLYSSTKPNQVKETLREALTRVETWPIESDSWTTLAGSHRKVYKRGYQGYHNAVSEPSVENFHEWRKRVKYRWYQTRLLKKIWPKIMKATAKELKNLSDYLGDSHDLAVLKQTFLNESDIFDQSETLDLLFNLIDRRRVELQTGAYRLGQRLYAETPDRYMDRMATWWKSWRNE